MRAETAGARGAGEDGCTGPGATREASAAPPDSGTGTSTPSPGSGTRPAADTAPGGPHPAMRRAFPGGGRATLGLIAPLESFRGDVPSMEGHLARVRAAEEAGFASFWLRDVPLLVPGQGDGGQLFDPWVYLGALATATSRITLGTASTVLPLRHPVHVAKAAASVDLLSGGRMLLGIAVGDRPGEVPAFGPGAADPAGRLPDSWAYLRHLTGGTVTAGHSSPLGELAPGIGMVPGPSFGRLPLLMTGRGGRTIEWVAEHADGWLYSALTPEIQRANTARWRRLTGESGAPGSKPYAQAGYLVLDEDPRSAPRPLPQGWAMGREPLLDLFKTYEAGGVDQLMVNLRLNPRPVDEVLAELAEYLLPHFPTPGPHV